MSFEGFEGDELVFFRVLDLQPEHLLSPERGRKMTLRPSMVERVLVRGRQVYPLLPKTRPPHCARQGRPRWFTWGRSSRQPGHGDECQILPGTKNPQPPGQGGAPRHGDASAEQGRGMRRGRRFKSKRRGAMGSGSKRT
jgi:hypothetical protein